MDGSGSKNNPIDIDSSDDDNDDWDSNDRHLNSVSSAEPDRHGTTADSRPTITIDTASSYTPQEMMSGMSDFISTRMDEFKEFLKAKRKPEDSRSLTDSAEPGGSTTNSGRKITRLKVSDQPTRSIPSPDHPGPSTANPANNIPTMSISLADFHVKLEGEHASSHGLPHRDDTVSTTKKAKKRRSSADSDESLQNTARPKIKKEPALQETALQRDQRTFNERYNIPEAPRPIDWERLPALTTATEIYFSVQTRGREITEIAVSRNDDIKVFHVTSAELKAKPIRCQDASPVPLQQALKYMCAFLSKSNNNVMIGYKLLSRPPGQLSLAVTLLHAIIDHNILHQFTNLVQGFLDSEVIISKGVKELKSRSASDEITTTRRIVNERRQEIDTNAWEEASFTVENALDFAEELLREESNYKTFSDMIRHKGCSIYYARKLARSNLKVCHLEAVYRKIGADGVKILLERAGHKAKDTITGVHGAQIQKIACSIGKYFDGKQQ